MEGQCICMVGLALRVKRELRELCELRGREGVLRIFITIPQRVKREGGSATNFYNNVEKPEY